MSASRNELDTNNDDTIDRTEIDDNNDGIFDRVVTTTRDSSGRVVREEHDNGANPKLLRREIDYDGDGTANKIHGYTYNAAGVLTTERIEYDYLDDGEVERIITNTLNEQGQVTRKDTDSDADGTVNQTLSYVYSGKAVTTEVHKTDRDDDGTTDSITTHTKNDRGQVTHTGFDHNGDGYAEDTRTFVYSGNKLTKEVWKDDRNEDGTVDQIIHITLNTAGRYILEETDSDADGNIDTIIENPDGDSSYNRIVNYSYDAKGVRISESFQIDYDDDGQTDRMETHKLNAQGHRTESLIVIRGGRQSIMEWYSYDDEGQPIGFTIDKHANGEWSRVVYDEDADGTSEKIHLYTYNSEGARTSEEIRLDNDDDGTVDQIELHTLNGGRHRIHSKIDNNADGIWDFAETYILLYHFTNGPHRTETDNDADGKIDRIVYDKYGDGEPEEIHNFTFNAEGVLATKRIEYFAFSYATYKQVTDRVATITVNAQGQDIRTETDKGNNGTIDQISEDPDGDLNADKITDFTYNDDGVKTTERIRLDHNDDGLVDEVQLHRLNAEGQRISSEYDYDADGTVDYIDNSPSDAPVQSNEVTREINDSGQLIELRYDRDRDGTAEKIHRYAYNAAGVLTTEKISFDNDDNDSADRIETHTLNPQGHQIRSEIDENADTTIDRIETYTLNSLGHRTQKKIDENNDGAIDMVEWYHDINGQGQPTRTNIDNDNDGTTDRYLGDQDGDGTPDRIIDYTYGEGGVSKTERIKIDSDDDGQIDAKYTSEYELYDQFGSYEHSRLYRTTRAVAHDDNQERPNRIYSYTYHMDLHKSVEVQEYDNNTDGEIDEIYKLKFNVSGSQIYYEKDQDANGSPELIWQDDDGDGHKNSFQYFYYNDNGDLTSQLVRLDNNDDGTWDQIESLKYNAEGQHYRSEVDENADGTMDLAQTYTLNGQGRPIRADIDNDIDGTVDSVEIYTLDDQGQSIRIDYDNNNNGKLDQIKHDRNVDGTFERIHDYSYNDEGVLTTETILRYNDQDGSLDRTEEYSLNAAGQRTGRKEDGNADGIFDSVETFTLNDQGQRIRIDYDDNNDGKVDRVKHDANDDGTPDETHDYTYNLAGVRTTETIRSFNSTDGRVTRIEEHTLNAAGQRIQSRIDSNGDGDWDPTDTNPPNEPEKPARVVEVEDDYGRLIRIRYYGDNDNTPERVDEFSYNAGGVRTLETVRYFNVVDGSVTRIESYTLNARGQRIRSEIDDNGDSTVDLIESFILNGRGQQTRIATDSNADAKWDRVRHDSDGDGTAERIHDYSYNARGFLRTERIRFDENDDSNLNRIELHTLNSRGHRIRSAIDSDADGTVDSVQTFVLNSRGLPIRTDIETNDDGNVDRIKHDRDADGKPHRIHDFGYENGVLTTEKIQYDYDDDGVVDRVTTFTVNAQKLVTKAEIDSDANGIVNRVNEYEYTGEVRTKEVWKFDSNGNGTIDRINTFTLNDQGARIRSELDSGADGKPDQISINHDGDRHQDEIQNFSYNDAGVLTTKRIRLDENDDGRFDQIELQTFNAQGHQTLNELDNNADGTVDSVETYRVDAQGQRTRTEFDNNNDGRVDRIRHDTDGNGTPERTHDYKYDDGGVRKIDRIRFYDADGNLERIESHALNADGARIRSEIDLGADDNIDESTRDDDGDGTANHIHRLTYNEGVLTTEIIRIDTNDDGEPDRIETHTYNAQVQRTRSEIDENGDGTVDLVETYSLDNGDQPPPAVTEKKDRLEKINHDSDGNGTTDSIHLYTYNTEGVRTNEEIRSLDTQTGRLTRIELRTLNADGQQTRNEIDNNADGTVDMVETFALNDQGEATRIATANYKAGRLSLLQIDADDDGTPEAIHDYSYNSGGVLASETIRFDNNDDDKFDRIETHTFNAQGDLIRIEVDSNADNVVDSTDNNPANSQHKPVRIERNAGDKISSIMHDRDSDGTPESIHDYTYNSQAVRTGEKVTYDYDDDGKADRIVTLTLNAQGQVTRSELDSDGDVQANRTNTFAYTGNVRSEEEWRFDDNEDGTTDLSHTVTLNNQGQQIRIETDYGDNGNVDQIIRDDDGDGTANHIRNLSYNAEGVLATERIRFDDNDDGKLDRIELHTSNAQGQRTHSEIDDDADGVVDLIDTFTLNDQGQTIRIDTDNNANGLTDKIEHDEDGDGVMEKIRDFTFNDEGKRATERVRLFDSEDKLSQTELHTLNAQGQRIRSEIDSDADGTVDVIETYTQRPYGDPIRIETDNGADGKLDRILYDRDGDGTAHRVIAYTYNDEGVRTLEAIEFDYDDDGETDRTEAFTLNGQGLLVRADFDNDADGTMNRVNTYAYTGNVRTTEVWQFDDSDNGTIDRVYTFTLNDQGQRISGEIDEGNDGNIDQTGRDDDGDGNSNLIRQFTYNATGMLTAEKVSTDGDDDGNFDRIELHKLNAQGQQTRSEIDRNADGTTDQIDIYQPQSENVAASLSSTENDGNFDLIQFGENADLTLASIYNQAGTPFRMFATSLEEIHLHDGGASELALTAENVRNMANGDGSPKIVIKGGNDDTVNLLDNTQSDGNALGTFVIKDDNDDDTVDTESVEGINYKVYYAQWGEDNTVIGSILIHEDVTVVLPS